jgi:hypothetical protein
MQVTLKNTIKVTPVSLQKVCKDIAYGDYDQTWEPVMLKKFKLSKKKIYVDMLADPVVAETYEKVIQKLARRARETYELKNPCYVTPELLHALPKKHWMKIFCEASEDYAESDEYGE